MYQNANGQTSKPSPVRLPDRCPAEVCGASTVAREPHVLSSLNRLNRVTERLIVLSEELEKRFNIVLRPQNTGSGTDCEKSAEPRAELAAAIDSGNYRLEAVSDRLESILNRCELPS